MKQQLEIKFEIENEHGNSETLEVTATVEEICDVYGTGDSPTELDIIIERIIADDGELFDESDLSKSQSKAIYKKIASNYETN